MKDYIKKLLKEAVLTEKLAEVDDDVDMLYDLYFKEDLEQLKKTGMITRDMFASFETDTSILRSPEAVKAHQMNPCKLLINHVKYSNGYRPNAQIITMKVNNAAIEYVLDSNGNLNRAYEGLSTNQQKTFITEFNPETIKGSIHHELAHWLDDTFNSQHIKKRVNKQIAAKTPNLKGIDVNSTKMELQGQIHNIKQYYNLMKDQWDELTFKQLVEGVRTLLIVYNQLQGETRKQWLRDLKTRMFREGLLGKNMINSFY